MILVVKTVQICPHCVEINPQFSLSQAQQGIQRKAFSTLDEMVEYYKLGKRGIVCALTIPIPQGREEEQEDADESG